jgi:Sap, sulfolipid-1-addressing protein
MFAEAAGLAALGAIYPPALLIAAVYLSSASPRKMTGLYLIGAVAITVVTGIALLVVLRAGDFSVPTHRTPRYGLRLGIGALAIAAAGYLVWRYRHRPPPDPAKPKKPGRIARMTAHPRPLTALVVGFLLFAPGAGFIAAVQVIATAKASLDATVGALALVVTIDIVFAWLPLLIHVVAPDRTTRALKALNTWLGDHGRTVLIAAIAAIGVILVIDGALGLA